MRSCSEKFSRSELSPAAAARGIWGAIREATAEVENVSEEVIDVVAVSESYRLVDLAQYCASTILFKRARQYLQLEGVICDRSGVSTVNTSRPGRRVKTRTALRRLVFRGPLGCHLGEQPSAFPGSPNERDSQI